MENNGHALLSPSGAKKWMTCPGSVAMEATEPPSTNEYADEGTAAHALAAMCLKEGTHPAAYMGRVLHVVDGVYSPDGKGTSARSTTREFEVDADMVAGVNAYVQKIHEYAQGSTAFVVEQPVPIGHVTGEEDATGTVDVGIFTTDYELQAHDLKYGMGVKVFAKDNPQAVHYLLGLLEYWGIDCDRFRVVIHQPRLNHIDEWAFDRATLEALVLQYRDLARTAMHAYEFRENWLGKSETYLVAGDHCSTCFCRAKAKCPTLAKFVTDTVGADFEVLAAMTDDKEESVAGNVAAADLATLGLKNKCVDLIEDWCKAIRAKVGAALFEANNSAETIAVLGHKLVQGKRGNRQWRDEGEAEALLKKMRLRQEEMYSFKLISPPAAEKLLKATPKRWERVAPLITQSEGKPHVAPVDDPRPAMVITPVADDFAAEDGSDLV